MLEHTCARCGAPVPRKTSKYCGWECFRLSRIHGDHVVVACPCGKQIDVQAWAAGRRKYCSQACKYRYRERPRGLKYDIKALNPGWRKPGDPVTPTSFRAGPQHPFWGGGEGSRKSERSGYEKLHAQLRKQRGRAANYRCALADWTCKGPMQWANISQRYLGVDDFVPLCQSHHMRYDQGLL